MKKIKIRVLPSGGYRLERETWAQVSKWPCSEEELRAGVFDPEWHEPFIVDCLRVMEEGKPPFAPAGEAL